MKRQRKDIYQTITDRIVADLEQGVRSWLKPWSAENAAGRITRPLRHNGKAYRGINILMLWGTASTNGFTSPYWLTFRQAQKLGAHVRKGEKGAPVVYANTFRKVEEDEDGQEVERDIPFLKGYTVFNADQIEDLPAHYTAQPEPSAPGPERIARAEDFIAATGADIRIGGAEAYYALHSDMIRVPPIEAFRDAESYYATLAHELTHWTRHPDRLDRSFGRKRFGDEGCAREELVAELGAAFLAADLDIEPEPREDHAAYLQSWLKVLRDDNRAIFAAAAHAQRAADYLHALQTNAEAA